MKQLIITLNCGSSSIKFAAFNADTDRIILRGLIEKINTDQTTLSWEKNGKKTKAGLPNIGYKGALKSVIELFDKLTRSNGPIVGVGHRVVHGGSSFREATLIDEQVITEIKNCIPLAPLHNPANLVGINMLRKKYHQVNHVAVFDTAFHQTMPKNAFLYAIPQKLSNQYGIRRYGFHGISHEYVSQEAAKLLNIPIINSHFITAHLGNGASVCAVKNGKSIDTSMGMTPLEGLVMGTRSGDVDPSLHQYLMQHAEYTIDQVNELLNKSSGLLGISELASDMRTLSKAASEGNSHAELAIDIFCYRLAKYIASYIIPLGQLDAVIFTGGIGENATIVREKTLQLLKPLGFKLDPARNNNHGKLSGQYISKNKSPAALVIPTNEELLIAREVKKRCHIL